MSLNQGTYMIQMSFQKKKKNLSVVWWRMKLEAKTKTKLCGKIAQFQARCICK